MIPPLTPPAERMALYVEQALQARRLGHEWRADAQSGRFPWRADYDREQAAKCFRRARDLLAVAKRIRDWERVLGNAVAKRIRDGR